MQNPSKINKQIDQKWTKNQSWRGLGGPWGPGAAKSEKRPKKPELLRPLGVILGPSWGPLGAVLALGSPSWADLVRLGVVLGRLGIDIKIDQKIDALQDRFWMRC